MKRSSIDERLERLAVRYELPETAPARLRGILDLVAAEPTSITTVRDPAQGVDIHVADALTGLEVPAVREASSIADLGAGGGFPGLALAIARPEARVALVESVGKKCDFLRRAAEAVGLANVSVVHARAEAWPEGLGAHDVVTARALASLNVVVEYAAPLVRERGTVVAYKAGRDSVEEADGEAAADVLGLQPLPPLAVEPFAGSGPRHLYLYLKVRQTPERFPRREGMARKRPLRASS